MVVWNVMLYVVTWALGVDEKRIIETFESGVAEGW